MALLRRRTSYGTLPLMTTNSGNTPTEREQRSGRGTKAPRTADELDRVARLRALHLQAGTAGLVDYCQRRLEQALPSAR